MSSARDPLSSRAGRASRASGVSMAPSCSVCVMTLANPKEAENARASFQESKEAQAAGSSQELQGITKNSGITRILWDSPMILWDSSRIPGGQLSTSRSINDSLYLSE